MVWHTMHPADALVLELAMFDDIQVHGYAFSGGGQSIIRVDVSADGGATWTTAELEPIDRRRYRCLSVY